MYFSNLKQVPLGTIAETFNQAFADYAIPMHFTEGQFKDKLLRDGTSLEFSVGAFEGEKLVGFILQGWGEWGGKITCYNGGTGVLPAFRGQKLTRQMYAYSLPGLKEAGVEQCLLEVIRNNQAAVRSYEAIGFKINRQFESYKGFLKEPAKNYTTAGFHFRTVNSLNREQVQLFWDYEPSWQYSFKALDRISHLTNLLEIITGDKLIGYGAITKNTNRIAQFAIAPAYRRKGLGTLLFHHLTQGQSGVLGVINIEANNSGSISFVESLGLSPFISQYEMLMPLH